MNTSWVMMAILVLLANLIPHSEPTRDIIFGTPYLTAERQFPVDPHRGARLSPAFQRANGPRGANLVAYFGTGNLRSYELPVPASRRYIRN